MRYSRTVLLGAVVALLFGSARMAGADPVLDSGALKVTSGFYLVDSGRDFFTFVASDVVDARQTSGANPPKNWAASCTACAAGDVVNLSFRNPSFDAAGFTQFVDLGSGTATIDTMSFPNAGFSGSLKFNAAPLLFPASAAPTVTLTTPFAFRGWFRLAGHPGPFTGGTEMRLGGSGFATATFRRDADVYRWGGVVRYEFQPTPEPSTLLLIGTGLAVCGRRAAKRLRRS